VLTKSYIFQSNEQVGGYPNVLKTVSEAASQKIYEVLATLFIHPVFVVIAVSILIFMAFKYKWRLIPLTPVFLMGLMSFVASSRFMMFLSPFMGVAYGYLIHFLSKYLPTKRTWLKEVVAYSTAGLLFLLSFNNPVSLKGITAYYTPGQSIPPVLFSTFVMLKEKLPKDAAVYTWWDFGLAIEAVSELATFHDGMTQNTPKTWLVAKSYVSPAEKLSRYVAYISNVGVYELDNMSPKEAVKRIDSYDKPLEKENVYLFFTQDMIQKFSAIEYIGTWDVDLGKPAQVRGLDIIPCENFNMSSLMCGGLLLNAEAGVLTAKNRILLNRIGISNDGVFEREIETGFLSERCLLLLKNGGYPPVIIIVNKEIYDSSFVQLYLLGNYNSEYFEEILNRFPLTRLYKVKSHGD
jgi:dolichyl-diphosphooligosaccharide--protein glycosyltransferase